MAFPKITDFVTYINRKLTGNDWNTNFQKIVNWLSLGDTDIKVKSVEADSIKYNGTTIVQNGNINTDTITANTVTSNSFIGDGSQLTNIKTESGFSYTPFCVNKGQVNSNGYGTFIDYSDTSKLVFRVGGDYSPLVVTTAKGKTITINSINDYDVSGLNGRYKIFVDEETNGGTVYLKTGIIYRQLTTPTGQNGDLWLDIRQEPYICREKVSNNWYTNEYDKVPIAIVDISGGEITSLEHLTLNYNYIDVVITETYIAGNNRYVIYSNGWCEQSGIFEYNANEQKTISFFQQLDTSKPIFISYNLISDRGGSASVREMTPNSYDSTGFTVYTSTSNGTKAFWKAEGYLL